MRLQRYSIVAPAFALALGSAACSRPNPEPGSPSDGSAMRPAAGTPMAGPRRPSRCLANFDAFDANGDGRVSRDEFIARPHVMPDPDAIFRARDVNGDENLAMSEFCARFRHGLADAGPGRGRGMRRDRASNFAGSARCEQHFDAFDADRDEKLTKDEFAAWPHVHGDADMLFSERDRDQDGIVTRDEFCVRWSGANSP
jgi:Ca2+-binding EF-hand superfamily protein